MVGASASPVRVDRAAAGTCSLTAHLPVVSGVQGDRDTSMTRVADAALWSGSLRCARLAAVTVCFAVVIAGCGGNELSLPEYVELINDAASAGR